MYPKILKIEVNADDYYLIVFFDNGEIVDFDMKSKFEETQYESLKDITLFKQAKVDPGGYGVSWNDEVDISEYEIWTKGFKRGKSVLE